ncbi:MAG: hypothetical protein ACYS80_24190 [Planctomycetota bacterium]|jgi:hypothetical protein
MPDYVPSVLGSIMKAVACTPNRNSDSQTYEQGVIVPARMIRKLWDELGDERPSDEQIREAIEALLLIFETKVVDIEERNERLREIFDLHELHNLYPDLLPLRDAADPSSFSGTSA